jgi:hypothetical protein
MINMILNKKTRRGLGRAPLSGPDLGNIDFGSY